MSLKDISSDSELANLDAGGTLEREFDGWRISRVQVWTEKDREEYGKSLWGSLAYEKMEIPKESSLPWLRILHRCAENLQNKQKFLSVYTNVLVKICIDQHPKLRFAFSLSASAATDDLPWIKFEVDERLLFLVVSGGIDWNNAEVGSHIKIDRFPDIYNPTAHTLMSYFSLLS